MAKTSKKIPAPLTSALDDMPPRRRAMLIAAFQVLMERGYAKASTLEIATRAKVSKRELYAEFGSKHGMLQALIASTAERMQAPLMPAEMGDRHAFTAALTTYGVAALGALTSPVVLATNRLAIAEAPAVGELGRILDESGRQPNRRALIQIMSRAQAAGFLGPDDPERIGGEFFSLLFGDLMLWLLMGVSEPPDAAEIRRRAERAAEAVLILHPV
jgi:AcrR family transcriptional regulator